MSIVPSPGRWHAERDAHCERYLYKLFFDSTPDPWTLTDPMPQVDSWPFRRGERVEPVRQLRFPVSAAGSALDLTVRGSWSGPIVVVTERIGALVEALAADDVQRIPARVDGTQERYELLHVLARIDCIDWENTPAYARRRGQAHGETGTLASLGELIDRDMLSRHVMSFDMRLRTEGSRALGSSGSWTGNCSRWSLRRSRSRWRTWARPG